MKKIFWLSVVVLSFAAASILSSCGGSGGGGTIPSTWQPVGSLNFADTTSNYPAAYFRFSFLNGEPFVVYNATNEKATAKIYNSSLLDWEDYGYTTFSTAQAYYISLTINNNIPYVAYRDINKAPSYATSVVMMNGNTREFLATGGLSSYSALHHVLRFSSSTAYVAYTVDGAYPIYTYVASFDGSAWHPLPVVFDNATNALDMQFLGAVPYVLYQELSNGKISVKKYNAAEGTWTLVGGGTVSTQEADYASLAVSNGYLYVAYQDGISGSATVKKYDNASSWITIGSPEASSGSAIYISLFVNNDTPYIAYKNIATGSGEVRRYNTSRGFWEFVGTQAFPQFCGSSIYVYNGVPYVAFEDEDHSCALNVMKYAP
jgi:hypothetical protein